MQKLVWQTVAAKERLWVQILQVKYYPNNSFWESKGQVGASMLWKALQEAKPDVIGTVVCQIGDGSTIRAVGEPWYPGWNRMITGRGVTTNLMVSDLYDHDNGQWKEPVIRDILGMEEAFQQIRQAVQKPNQNPLINDRVISSPAKTGIYTVKEGYRILVGAMQSGMVYEEEKLKALQAIWQWKGIIPKIKTFLWRVLHGGLATTHELSRRVRKIQPVCPRCRLENEYTMHLLFFCPASRAIWFAPRIPLRVGDLPLNFAATLIEMAGRLNQTQMVYFCNVLWMLWKVRNEEIFKGKKPDIREGQQQRARY